MNISELKDKTVELGHKTKELGQKHGAAASRWTIIAGIISVLGQQYFNHLDEKEKTKSEHEDHIAMIKQLNGLNETVTVLNQNFKDNALFGFKEADKVQRKLDDLLLFDHDKHSH